MDIWVEQWQKWGQLVVRSWDDDIIRQRMIDDPAGVLAEIGVTIPAGCSVKVVTDLEAGDQYDDTTLVLPLPNRPPDVEDVSGAAELTEHELAHMSGGAAWANDIGRALSSMPHGGYLGGTIVPIRVPSSWATIPTP